MRLKKNDIKILTQTLNLPNYVAQDVRTLEGIGIVIHVESQNNFAICPRCNTKSHHLHQNHDRTIEDLPWGEYPVYLRVNARQFKCSTCGKPFTEDLEFTLPRRSYTKRFALNILQQSLDSNILRVAQRTGLSEYRIEHILEDAAQILKQQKPQGLRILGIDEISWAQKGRNYCAVLVDLETHTVIDLVKSRKQEVLRGVFRSWGEETLQGIEWVSIDLWRPYQGLVEELMPNAEVVADRFHVMKGINEELDSQRKEEVSKAKKIRRKAEREKVVKGLKKSKYILLKNQEELNEEQKEKLEEVKNLSPILAEMHELKEQFREIFETSKSWAEGSLRLLDWLLAAGDKFPHACKTIINWFGEITIYFECHITNGIVEGINNKLKQIKRAAYGFCNFDNFVTRVLLSFCKSIDLAY
jgi:transposase